MTGLGTLLNAAGIIFGGLIGLIGKKFIKESYRDTLLKATGICVLFIGLGGTLEQMMTVENNGLTNNGTMLIIISFALGALIGEVLKIEKRVIQFGEWLKSRTGNNSDYAFVDAFVSASLTVCIGAMAIVGAIQDGVSGDYSVLATKAVLDMLIIMTMTASMGKGCIFAAIPVVLFQGFITVLARLIAPFLIETALNNLALIGSMLIFCVGINLIWPGKIRVANMLPAVVIAVILAYLSI